MAAPGGGSGTRAASAPTGSALFLSCQARRDPTPRSRPSWSWNKPTAGQAMSALPRMRRLPIAARCPCTDCSRRDPGLIELDMLDRTFVLAVKQLDPPVGRLGQSGIGHIGPPCDDAPYRPMPAVIRRQRRRQSRSRPGIVVVNQQKISAGQSQQDGRSGRARQSGIGRFRPASAVIVGHADPMATSGSASHYRQ